MLAVGISGIEPRYRATIGISPQAVNSYSSVALEAKSLFLLT